LALISLAECLILAEAVRELMDVDLAEFRSETQGLSVFLNMSMTVAPAGDVNDDGLPDTLIGRTNSGSPVYLIFGKPNGTYSTIYMNSSWNSAYGIQIT